MSCYCNKRKDNIISTHNRNCHRPLANAMIGAGTDKMEELEGVEMEEEEEVGGVGGGGDGGRGGGRGGRGAGDTEGG